MTIKRKIYVAVSWTLVVLILWGIFSLSAQDAEESQALSDSIVSIIIEWISLYINGETLRKIAHMLEFTALSFSLNNAIFATWEKKNASLISLMLTIIVMISDEIHQIFVPGRAFQFSDLLIDGIGAILGIIAYLVMYKMFLIIMERRNKNGNIKTI